MSDDSIPICARRKPVGIWSSATLTLVIKIIWTFRSCPSHALTALDPSFPHSHPLNHTSKSPQGRCPQPFLSHCVAIKYSPVRCYLADFLHDLGDFYSLISRKRIFDGFLLLMSKGLKIPWGKPCAGSSPAVRTSNGGFVARK